MTNALTQKYFMTVLDSRCTAALHTNFLTVNHRMIINYDQNINKHVS